MWPGHIHQARLLMDETTGDVQVFTHLNPIYRNVIYLSISVSTCLYMTTNYSDLSITGVIGRVHRELALQSPDEKGGQ